MPESVVATIEKVEPIRGTGKNNKPYTLYKIYAGGETYTSFNEEWRQAVGQERTIEYETSKSGAYTNRRIVDPKPQRRWDGRLAQRVEDLHVKVDKILEILGARE